MNQSNPQSLQGRPYVFRPFDFAKLLATGDTNKKGRRNCNGPNLFKTKRINTVCSRKSLSV
jgi:hypothetical protein